LEAVIFNPLAIVEANEELIAFKTYDADWAFWTNEAVAAYDALRAGIKFKFILWEVPP
jgi:hypothetical protein